MAGKPTTLGGCELDQTAECSRGRAGGWFVKGTQGLLRIQEDVVGRWWAMVVVARWWGLLDYCESVVAMVPVVGVVREGCTRAVCSRMGHRKILPTQPCIRRL